MEPSASSGNSTAIPIAIVAGFAMIALAIFLTSDRSTSDSAVGVTAPNTAGETVIDSSDMKPVDENDYILGNPNAPIVLVEYSDYECPFCKQYHATLHRIMDEYGVTGRVAWAYRQFPVGQLHPNAPKISEAALCVGELGGNSAFWEFSDLLFDEREVDEFTNVTRLPEYAESAGVDRDAYITCMDERRHEATVAQSVENGFNMGIRGTPHTVLVVGNQQATINGAESYEFVKGLIENLLQQLDGEFDAEAEASATEVPAQ